MRLRNAIAGGLLLAFAIGGCSRLTFVKPNLKRHHYRQVAPEYNLRADPEGAKRVSALDRIAVAEQQLRAGQLDQAQTEALAAAKDDPTSADALILLGMIAERKGQTAAAGASYAKAVALSPKRGIALNDYGAWLCGTGRAGESLAFFDRALADPSYTTPGTASANAGACALTAGQSARALANLQYALQLDPENPVALATMARYHYQTGNYMQARAFSERRLAAAPASVEVLQLASQIEQKLGDSTAAARYVQQIRQEFPPTTPASPGDASHR